MILINGQNYFPNDLDIVIEELPFIKFQQIATCGIFNETVQKDDIYVFIVPQSNQSNLNELEETIKKHVSTKTRLGIKKVIPVNNIPRTTTGKVQRHILVNNYLKGFYNVKSTHFASNPI